MTHKEKVLSVKNYWNNKMPMMTIEEMAELTQAISKYERYACNENYEQIVKELADVYIALEAYQMYISNLDLKEDGGDWYWNKMLNDVNEAVEAKLNKKY